MVSAGICEVSATERADQMAFTPLWESEPSALPSDYDGAAMASWNGASLLVTQSYARNVVDVYQVAFMGSGIERVTSMTHVPGSVGPVALHIGDVPYVITYASDEGKFRVFSIGATPVLSPAGEFSDGVNTRGFTTVAPFSYTTHPKSGPVTANYVLAYNSVSGAVRVYQLQRTAGFAVGWRDVWSHQWSDGWRQFSFFQMGGENFFFKNNLPHANVNIDFMSGDPSAGSHPVGSHLPLPLDLAAVACFEYLGNPYFATLRSDGHTTVNRFNADGQGWVQQVATSAGTVGKLLVPFALDGQRRGVFWYGVG